MSTRPASLILFTAAALSLAVPSSASYGEVAWTTPAVVRHRDTPVVSYRASLQGDILVIEATHEPGWHTYALDNIERAKKKTGKEKPETELPTRIRIEGGLEQVGHWYQTLPKDLSQPDLFWYTWGFEDRSIFAAKVEKRLDAAAVITIDGQACNASSCKMVDGIQIVLPLSAQSAGPPFDFDGLDEVRPAP